MLIQIAADDLYYKRVNGAPVTDLEIGFGERNAKEWTRVRRDGATITIKENPQQTVKPSIVRFSKMWTIEPDTTQVRLIVRDRMTARFGVLDMPLWRCGDDGSATTNEQRKTNHASMTATAAVLCSFFLLHSSLFRWQAQELPVFKATAESVVVPVTVTDRSGHFVSGLTAADFELSDGGTRREITQFSTERVPVSLGILLDISGSMATDAKARAARRCAVGRYAAGARTARPAPRSARRGVVRRLRRQGGAGGSVDAGSSARARARSIRSDPGATPRFRRGEIDCAGISARGARAQGAARDFRWPATAWCRASAARLLPVPADRESSRCRLEIQPRQHALRDTAVGAAQQVVKQSGAALYAIGMGTGKGAYVDLENLESLTANSGGYVEAINDPAEITAAVARIFDELQSQYILAFEPAHADGKCHEISVTTKNGDLRVRARAGYEAGESKKVESESRKCAVLHSSYLYR